MSELRVVVTGGGRGIGRAIALRFAREGAKVVVMARTATELDTVVKEIDAAGGHGHAAQMNVEDVGDVGAAIWRASQFTGGAFDVLVNCAGIFEIKPFQQMDQRTWDRMLAVNLSGPFNVLLEGLEYLQESEKAHVFNIGSVAGKQGFPGNTAYCASKYGLRGFGDALRLDLEQDGIRVSTVQPGNTDTTIYDNVEGEWDRSGWNAPEDVAEVIWNAYNAPADADVANLDVPPPA